MFCVLLCLLSCFLQGHDISSRTPRVRNLSDSQSHGGFKGNGTHVLRRSALGGTYADTPLVVPTRGCLDAVRRLLRGDLYIGRGCRQRGLAKEPLVQRLQSVHARPRYGDFPSSRRSSNTTEALRADVWSLSGFSSPLPLHSHAILSRGRHHRGISSSIPRCIRQGSNLLQPAWFRGSQLSGTFARRR